MSQMQFKPPVSAIFLLSLFAPYEQRDAMLGDLLEEVSELAVRSGLRAARTWYWKQTLRSVVHILASGLSSFWTLGAVTACVSMGIAGIWLTEGLVIAILYRFRVYLYVDPWWFWLSYAIVVARFVVPLVAGFLAASVAKGREMIATIVAAFVFGAIGLYHLWPFIGGLYLWNDYRFPRPIVAAYLACTFLSPIGIVVGGYIRRVGRERKLRSAAG